MTASSYTLPLAHLRAALLFAGKNDIRPSLNTAHVDVQGNTAYVVGTDAHRLGVFRCRMPGAAPAQFLIPRGMLDGLKPVRSLPDVVVQHDATDGALTITYDRTTVTGRAIDAKPWDWRRVMPGPAGGAPTQFNPSFMADLVTVAKVLRVEPASLHISHNGDAGVCRVQFLGHPDFLGVLMGLRQGAAQGMPESAARAFAAVAPDAPTTTGDGP